MPVAQAYKPALFRRCAVKHFEATGLSHDK